MKDSISPKWNITVTLCQVAILSLSVFWAYILGLISLSDLESYAAHGISAEDQILLNSWGIGNLPQFLISIFTVSFLVSFAIQCAILAIPNLRLRKKESIRLSLLQVTLLAFAYVDLLIAVVPIRVIQVVLYPHSSVALTLVDLLSAGILIGGLAAKATSYGLPTLLGYVVLPATEGKTPFLVKHTLKLSGDTPKTNRSSSS